ncbi:MAG: DUF418 domain-containing protein [Bryobacterales bacterium]|nr:DUF418 domain-containing protein [Bryobacterales bacterium]
MPDGNFAGPAPVAAGDRVEALDTVRGFALLGILLMNICNFGMPAAAESNPTVWGGATGADYWLWWVQSVFWSGKMRALFSICFGAGVIYLTERAEARGASAAEVYYRRTFWLMAFGMVHAYGLWYGDILYPYALMGLVLYPLRKLGARWLAGIGVAMVILACGTGWEQATETKQARDSFRGIPEHADVAKEVESARSAYQGLLQDWQPSRERIDRELKAYRGDFASALAHRREARSGWDSQPYYSTGNWDVLAFMLIGMALAKWGALAGAWTGNAYAWVAILGIGIGGAMGVWAANHEASSNFSPVAAMEAYTLYQPVRLLMGLGYVAAIVGVVRAGRIGWLTGALRAVGRMAFSNYILQTLLCTTLFYGQGFGWYGQLRRHELYYVVAAIWVLQLVVSPIWLRHYRFGPLEWAWRSLTYWQRQPMRVATSGQSLPAENPV